MQPRSEETRRHILDAAQRQFAMAGYDATGVAEICAAAGVSKGAFYHHFPTKQSLFLVLLQEWLTGLELELDRAVVAGDSAPERLLNMAKMARMVFEAADGRLPIFLEFWRQASRDEAVWKATVAPYRRFNQRFIRLVEDGIREGSLNPVEPDAAARVIVALAVGMLLQGMLDPGAVQWDKATWQGMQLFLNGLARRES